AATWGGAEVGAGVDHAGGDVDGLARAETSAAPVDGHLELALEDVDRLGCIAVQVGGQRPARGRVIDQEAEGAVGVGAGEVDLGANATRHPDDLWRSGHRTTITA